jgi:hypothetical protein
MKNKEIQRKNHEIKGIFTRFILCFKPKSNILNSVLIEIFLRLKGQ